MGVLAIWRYPVKAMLGESLRGVAVGAAGCAGDRRWVVVDRRSGERIADKRGPTDPRLRACRAELLDEDGGLPLRVALPDGAVVSGSEVEPALSDLLEREIFLRECVGPATGALGATGAHHDVAPLHLLTTGTLARLRAAAPECDWDVRRFRPNLVLDDGVARAEFAEDALVGGALRGPSGLGVAVRIPTPRCVVPTRRHAELPADPSILRRRRRAPARPRPVRSSGLRRYLRERGQAGWRPRRRNARSRAAAIRPERGTHRRRRPGRR